MTLRVSLEGVQTHGIMVITKKGLVAQALGLPFYLSKLIVIPKYLITKKRTPWKRNNFFFKRIISEYGPKGLQKAAEEAKDVIDKCYSDLFRSYLPCLDINDIALFSEPKEALCNLIKKPKLDIELDLVLICNYLREQGIPLEDIGITGSVALKFANSKISDIDLVIYGSKSAQKILQIFMERRESYANIKNSFGGLKVQPSINTEWRRTLFFGRRFVSWVGVPNKPMSHCPKLIKERSPSKRCKLKVKIDENQESSLLYPPCVEAKSRTDEISIISFEYNIAEMFFKGGTFEIEGICSKDNDVIYLATREFPGMVIKIRN